MAWARHAVCGSAFILLESGKKKTSSGTVQSTLLYALSAPTQLSDFHHQVTTRGTNLLLTVMLFFLSKRFSQHCEKILLALLCVYPRPPLWSSGQSFWLQIQRSRVRFPALPDFLSSSGSGTGSTQPREVN